MNCPSLITVVCCKCGLEMERKDGFGIGGISHGLCDDCLERHYPIGGSEDD